MSPEEREKKSQGDMQRSLCISAVSWLLRCVFNSLPRPLPDIRQYSNNSLHFSGIADALWTERLAAVQMIIDNILPRKDHQ